MSDEETIRSQLSRAHEDEPSQDQPAPEFEDAEAEAAYWRTRFEQERERLAKLWVAYRDVEAELELRKEEAETIAQRKAAAQLAQAEQATGADASEEEAEQPGVLAIAPPDEFEVVCEAEERDVVVGRGTSFPLVFVNRSDSPVTARLSVEESPEGWSALTAEQEGELDGQSSQTVYVLVRPPAEAPVGEEGRVVVAVETDQETETLELVAEVVEPPETDEEVELEEPTDEQPEVSQEALEEESPDAEEDAEEADAEVEAVDGGNGASVDEEQPIEAQAAVEREGTVEDEAPDVEDEET